MDLVETTEISINNINNIIVITNIIEKDIFSDSFSEEFFIIIIIFCFFFFI